MELASLTPIIYQAALLGVCGYVGVNIAYIIFMIAMQHATSYIFH